MSVPFDKARYAALLEGLEISEIRKKELNDETRYEAEFFRKRYLLENQALSRWPLTTIGAFAAVTDGPHGYHVVDESSPIVMLTAKNARGWFSDREGADPIAKWVDEKNKRSSLAAGDVILSDRGTVGMCALVTEEALPANIDQDVARISWEDKKKLRPDYVVAYLNSSFGQDHMQRFATGMIQQGITLQKIRQIPIPMLSVVFQAAISETVQSAYRANCDSITHLTIAEQTLLAALDLADWYPPEPLTYTRSSKEVLGAERFDSEFFKPKFDELVLRIRRCGKCVPLGTLLAHNQRGKQPIYAETGLCVVNSKHVLKNEVVLGEDNDHAQSIPDAQQIRYGDVVINGTGVGTIGRAATFLHKTPAIPDNHVTILRLKDASIDPVFLSVYLNSITGQIQVNKWLHGSSGQIELYPADIAQFQIWIAPSKVQRTIRDKIEGAFAARNNAKSLLTRAQRAVEIAIEKNEASALRFLKEKGV